MSLTSYLVDININPNSDLKLTITQMLTLVPLGYLCYKHFKVLLSLVKLSGA